MFNAAPIVAFGEAHWLEQQHALLRTLLLDPRFAATVNAVAVEFGVSTHQAVIDRFLAGERVEPEQLRRIWREAPGGARSGAFESPVYEAFFHVAREAARASERGLRVLLGDPPTAWREDGASLRDEHFAQLVEREVLGRGKRTLIIAGGGHVGRVSDVAGGNVVQRLEAANPGSCAVVLPHYVFPDVLERRAAAWAELEERLREWPVPSLAPIAGTWLADVDATLLFGDTARVIEPDGTTSEVPAPFLAADSPPLDSVSLGEVADAYLYLGPVRTLTLAAP